jgi:hypothetical protein
MGFIISCEHAASPRLCYSTTIRTGAARVHALRDAWIPRPLRVCVDTCRYNQCTRPRIRSMPRRLTVVVWDSHTCPSGPSGPSRPSPCGNGGMLTSIGVPEVQDRTGQYPLGTSRSVTDTDWVEDSPSSLPRTVQYTTSLSDSSMEVRHLAFHISPGMDASPCHPLRK